MSLSITNQPLPKEDGLKALVIYLSNFSESVNIETLSIKISSLISNYDPSLLTSFIDKSFQDLSNNRENSILIQNYCKCFEIICQRISNTSFFPVYVQKYFDSQAIFPSIPIALLSRIAQLSIVVFAINTRHSNKSMMIVKELLSNGFSSKEIALINERVLFEINSSPEISKEGLSLSLSLPCQYPSLERFYSHPSNISKISSKGITPCLFDVVIECEPRSLTTLPHLERLVSYYPSFNASHAAEYLTAISSPLCKFRQFFQTLEEMQRERVISLTLELFSKNNVNSADIVYHLDQPHLPPLDFDGCLYILNFLSYFQKGQKIDLCPFLTTWKNKSFQAPFIAFIASRKYDNVYFSEKCRIVSQATAQEARIDESSIINRCWLCTGYVERVCELYKVLQSHYHGIIQESLTSFSSSTFLSLSQAQMTVSGGAMQYTLDLFSHLMCSQNQQFFEIVWKSSPEFLVWIIVAYYRVNPNKVTKIAEMFSSHIHQLLKADGLDFVIDIAFKASYSQQIDIESFIHELVKRYSKCVFKSVLSFLKSEVINSEITYLQGFYQTINSVFRCIKDNFRDLSSDIQLMTLSVYSICEFSVKGIAKVTFSDYVSPFNYPDVKKSINEMFSSFLSNELSMDKLVMLIHHSRSFNPQLFSVLCSVLIAELKFISKYEFSTAEKLGALFGNMINEGLFNDTQTTDLISDLTQKINYFAISSHKAFVTAVLSISIHKLSKYPHFIFDLLKQNDLKNYDSALYHRIKKISQLISSPARLIQSVNITMSPSIKHFASISLPPPRLCKIVQAVYSDPEGLSSTLPLFEGFTEWLALQLVVKIEDHPAMLSDFIPHFNRDLIFSDLIVRAASFEALSLILKSKDLSSYEGGFKRRRLSVLGRLIGSLTFGINRPLFSKYIDLKHLLLYGLTRGCLLSILPFVSAVLMKCSEFFYPPNPYTCSILQVLASIKSIELLKLSIKNHISLIFNHFKASSAQFELLSLIPDLSPKNFDFFVPPFSLTYIKSPTEIEKIISLDEASVSSLVAQYLIIPDYTGDDSTVKREKFKSLMSSAVLNYLKSDGTNLAKTAQSTASELIIKDFALCNNPDKLISMNETANTLTKQLSAGLVMFTVVQRQHLVLFHAVSTGFPPSDQEWVVSAIQLNHYWISQLLKDVVQFKAWKSVQQRIEQSEEQKKSHVGRHIDPLTHKAIQNLPSSIAPSDQGLLPQHLAIYQNIAEYQLSPALVPFAESTVERNLPPNDELEGFFSQASKLIAKDIAQNPSLGNEPNPDLPQFTRIPEIKTYESFSLAIRLLLKYVSKSSPNGEKIFSNILHRIVTSVSPKFISDVQNNVIGWIRNYIPSVNILIEYLRYNLITTKQLDQFFFDSLNRQPVNVRLLNFAIRFLHQVLVVKSYSMKASDMIDTLSIITSNLAVVSEFMQSQNQPLIEELNSLYENMDVPLNILSPNSKLQSVSIFDPLENCTEQERLLETFSIWNDCGDNKTLLEQTSKCIEFGKDFFIYLFYHEPLPQIYRFLSCVESLCLIESYFSIICESLIVCIQGNGTVIGFDNSKYYYLLLNLQKLDLSIENRKNIAYLLHATRPLVVPSFTFSWILLVSERHFVSFIAVHFSSALKTLVEDFALSVSLVQSSQSSESFNLLYKSFLRFLLVVSHDFGASFVQYVPEIVSLIPFSFIQVRNILLSIPHNNPTNQLANIYSYNDFDPIHVPNYPDIDFDMIINNLEQYKTIIPIIEKQSDLSSSIMTSLIVTLINKHLPSQNTSDYQNSIENNPIYHSILQIIASSSGEVLFNVISVLLDQLRYPSRITILFIQIFILLFKQNIKIKASIQLNELIFTLVGERVSSPAPHPWGLIMFLRILLFDVYPKLKDIAFVEKSQVNQQFVKGLIQIINSYTLN